MRNKKIFDFLNEIREGEYNHYDIYVTVKEMTNNFDETLLKHIERDIDFYLFTERDFLESNFSEEDVQKKIDELNKRGIKAPVIKSKLRNGTEYLDIEKLMYPHEFWNVYEFRNFILSRIHKEETENFLSTIKKPLKWTKKKIDLTEVIVALIESGAISKENHSEVEIFDTFGKMFDIDFSNQIKRQQKSDLKKREKQIDFLHELVKNLQKWYDNAYE